MKCEGVANSAQRVSCRQPQVLYSETYEDTYSTFGQAPLEPVPAHSRRNSVGPEFLRPLPTDAKPDGGAALGLSREMNFGTRGSAFRALDLSPAAASSPIIAGRSTLS